jgi:hypothetical protein
MRLRTWVFLAWVAMGAGVFRAQAEATVLRPVTPACLVEAGLRMGVPPLALVGIMTVEDGQVGRSTPDSNGTRDFGPMQINSVNLPRLWARFGLSRRTIEDNGCANVWAGAWILRKAWLADGSGTSVWLAIAHYHSSDMAFARPYALKVYRTLARGISLQAVLRHANE